MPNVRKLLFTDLDGSLLDHYDYDYSAALPAIALLGEQQIPWILTTSKTAAEVIELRAELDNNYPFIVENGAAIFWTAGAISPQFLPKNSLISHWGEEFDYVSLNRVSMPKILQRAAFYKKQLRLNFIGFSQMSIQQVANCTGLTLLQAAKAKQRQFSEPLLWQDTQENLIKFRQALQSGGLQLIQGGRFVHLMGPSNKGVALQWLTHYYHQAWSQPIETMALGDGNNDIALLEASDCPVIIRSPVNAPPKVNHPNVIITKAYGPLGWNQAVLNWLEK
ncbi:MAG: HAD-IIB family hydrolase [Pseudomonadota bacterium]